MLFSLYSSAQQGSLAHASFCLTALCHPCYPTLPASDRSIDRQPAREGIIQGHQDYDLTPVGVSQAVATAIRLRENKYWQTHSSDLMRAYRTAEIILKEHHLGKEALSKTPLLREFGLGAQEGLPRGTTWCGEREGRRGILMIFVLVHA